MDNEEITRRDLLRVGLALVGSLTILSCGGGGGGGLGSTTRSVLDRTIAQYGSDSVVADPESPDYLVQVGTLAPTNDSQGLIFQINGQFPPETSGDVSAARTFMVRDTDTITWLLVTRR